MEFNTSHPLFSWPMEVLCQLSGNKVKLGDIATDFGTNQDQIRIWLKELRGFGIVVKTLGHHCLAEHGYVVFVEKLYIKRVERYAREYYEEVYEGKKKVNEQKKPRKPKFVSNCVEQLETPAVALVA